MKILLTFLTIVGCEENNKDKVEMKFSKDVCKKIFDKARSRTNTFFMLNDGSYKKDAVEFAHIYNAFCKD